ncbi:MAG TPA: NrfD/PsrC family molybdoenzyme membrane anchor subunit [Candidatus Baltobacteraceae bacterium]|nr:NrfD/PsrC family molybdoenzyme membrane anchor subunit [Candidatus Baltobacteraceae bacterium]
MDSEGSQKIGAVAEPDALLAPGHTFESVTDKISAIVLSRPVTPGWVFGALIGFALLMLLNLVVTLLMVKGVGIWGIRIPAAWGFAIVNFVWWIGIGHAGTLISAILLLLHQKWRTSINRFAEAMTIFAVMCAGMFPLLHMGRPWLFFYLMPYPNPMWLWPQFRSPLVWDVFAVSTYFTVSLLFWFIGLIPDLATLRDRAKGRVGKIIYGMLSMGWRGSAVHWSRYEMASLLLAGLATPLVLSVHTVVSFDFTIGIIPGWHTTIFPPYFVAGAIYSGFAMVLTLAIPIRKYYHLEDLVTMRHLDLMAKVMLATGLIVAYGYGTEAFMSWYSADQYERYMLWNRIHGPYHVLYFMLLTCNIFLPQLLWSKKVRQNIAILFVISLIVNMGMWLERFVIVVISLSRDFIPSSWAMYYPTKWDWATFLGTFGLFFFLFFLFIRFLPMISIVEVRSLVHETNEEAAHS